jgi:hypothetical protein
VPTVDDYLSLIAPQYAYQPSEVEGAPARNDRFTKTLLALLLPLAEADGVQGLLRGMPKAFDLDFAVGVQLDQVGLWVGQSRVIVIALESVFLTFDGPAKLGWDNGVWKQRYDDTTTQFSLPDEDYRLLLRAKIAANSWDGTLAGAQRAYGYIFPRTSGTQVFVQDNQDKTFTLNQAGLSLSAVRQALLTGGYLALRPAGYRLLAVNFVSIGGAPLFGFDIEDPSVGVAGFDEGAWGVPPVGGL